MNQFEPIRGAASRCMFDQNFTHEPKALKVPKPAVGGSAFWIGPCFLLAAIASLLSPQSTAAQTAIPVAPAEAPVLLLPEESFEEVVQPAATAYRFWVNDPENIHEVWYRITGTSAQAEQRLRVYKENTIPYASSRLPTETEIVQGIASNVPSRWYRMAPARGAFTYYFFGDHRSSFVNDWQSDLGVAITRTSYQNGERFEIYYEDQESLDDYNDLEVEVVVLFKGS